MKKLLYFAAAFAMIFSAGSCQRENLEPVTEGVTYTITLPVVETKGETGYAEYDLYYQVYKTADATEMETATLLFEKKKVEMTGNTTTLNLDLLNDQDYTILFWANKKGADYFDLANLRKVGMKQAASNNEDRDAFCGMDQLVGGDTGVKTALTEIHVAAGGVGPRAHGVGLLQSGGIGMERDIGEIRAHFFAQLGLDFLGRSDPGDGGGDAVSLRFGMGDLVIQKMLPILGLHQGIQLTAALPGHQTGCVNDGGILRRRGGFRPGPFLLCIDSGHGRTPFWEKMGCDRRYLEILLPAAIFACCRRAFLFSLRTVLA